jgi:nucleoside 2-deoxyribosyltransferase
MEPNTTHTVYFAGELFSAKHLIGNALIVQAIHEYSEGRFRCLLPQDLETQEGEGDAERDPQTIRDADLTNLLGSDLAIFNFDGPKLDSGTVVEFMFSKFADIPSVIVRTDFRNAGDSSSGDPWNLMSSFFPRTEILLIHSVSVYQRFVKAGKAPWEASSLLAQHIARSLLLKMEEALRTPPVLPATHREIVFDWLRLMPAFKDVGRATMKLKGGLAPHRLRRSPTVDQTPSVLPPRVALRRLLTRL